MGIAKFSERLMSMDDAAWVRHSNPWSGWTRLTILPFLSLAVWSRVWLGWGAIWLILIVIVWTWVNPRLFGPPIHSHAWMTKAVLGERVWIDRGINPIPAHHVHVGRILMLVTGIGVFALIYALWQLDLGWLIAGLVTSMGAKLWFLDRMVWLLADQYSKMQ
ncbi:DUF6653 family protein [Loktanella sp. Alg231-35]|uniref:DUF6653 family protein n=1 Tax=Loktanella sp. Alg231-35 TaxID=1922220 RepID=UPI000D55ED85|nr:DUF6653 family protein [Loktanella sp. Alg231-35]